MEALFKPGLSRRELLAATGALAVTGLTQPAHAGAFFWGRLFSVPPRDTPFITPNNQFYRVNYSDRSLALGAEITTASWTLRVHGAVEHPRVFRYVDVLEQRSVDQIVTLQCIDNEPGGSLMSNAQWSGFWLSHIMEAAAPYETAVDVVFRGVDGYHDSITLDRALHGDVMLAHSMNGVTLPKDHGYPLRAIVPGVFGIKNVKWLTEIEVVERDHKGYWQERGWTDEGLIPVASRIDRPGHYQVLRGGRQELRGIAFGGLHGIKRVEVSVDGGRTWRDAVLSSSAPYSWVKWSYEWIAPAAGAYTVVVRAEGVDGFRQVETASRAYPTGTSGLHTIIALLESV